MDNCVLCGSEPGRQEYTFMDDEFCCSNDDCVLNENLFTEEEWAKLGGKS